MLKKKYIRIIIRQNFGKKNYSNNYSSQFPKENIYSWQEFLVKKIYSNNYSLKLKYRNNRIINRCNYLFFFRKVSKISLFKKHFIY